MKKEVLREIRKSFPKAEIISSKKLEGGIMSLVYKVSIEKPKKSLAVKIYKSKHTGKIRTNNKILAYLHGKKFPVPQIYSDNLIGKRGFVVMDYINGENASIVHNKSSPKIKKRILENAGKLLRKLHSLKIPKFWVHHKHEIKNKKEWIEWTEKRIEKYLNFARFNLDKRYYLFLKREFASFLKLLNKNMKFVPMHWDYHLANLLATEDGNIICLFDFENAMKGHNLSDIGQAKYWLIFRSNDYKNFEYFLKGYGRISKKERKLVDGYFLLHLIAVTRSIWRKKKRLNWIIKKHFKMLNKIIKK